MLMAAPKRLQKSKYPVVFVKIESFYFKMSDVTTLNFKIFFNCHFSKIH